MSRRSILIATGIAASLSMAGFGAIAVLAPKPRLLWNASASAPIGLYRLHPVRAPAAGDLVAILPPKTLARFMAERHYLPVAVPMLKHLAAGPGSAVCRHGPIVTIGGRVVATARTTDRVGRPLPVWRGCRTVGAREVFLLNPAADSMDGRYFGPISAAGLLGRAQPIFTRASPSAPLLWRSTCTGTTDFAQAQGGASCK